jgi:hypothetical protein
MVAPSCSSSSSPTGRNPAAHGDVVDRAVGEERAEWRTTAGLPGDSLGELRRVVVGDADIGRAPAREHRRGGVGADRAQRDRERALGHGAPITAWAAT